MNLNAARDKFLEDQGMKSPNTKTIDIQPCHFDNTRYELTIGDDWRVLDRQDALFTLSAFNATGHELTDRARAWLAGQGDPAVDRPDIEHNRT